MRRFDVVVIDGGPADGALSPRVIFTDPQVAAVGHTTDTAARAGLAVDAYDTDAVPPFPTRSEIGLSLLEQVGV
jgi:hypothetical protein